MLVNRLVEHYLNLSRRDVGTGQKPDNNRLKKTTDAVNEHLAAIKRSAIKLCFHTFWKQLESNQHLKMSQAAYSLQL